MRYQDLYSLSIGEYEVMMRAYCRSKERDLHGIRKILMELRNGNVNIKKSGKYKKESDIFYLESIDGRIIPATATKITQQQADTMSKQGYTVPKSFIE